MEKYCLYSLLGFQVKTSKKIKSDNKTLVIFIRAGVGAYQQRNISQTDAKFILNSSRCRNSTLVNKGINLSK